MMAKAIPLEILKGVDHFTELPEHILIDLADSGSPQYFEAEQVIYLEGEPAEKIYILEQGWIRATRMSAEGREQAMMFLRPVEIFGDIAVLTDSPYPCTVVALEPVKVWAINKQSIQELIFRYPELASAVIRRLGDRVKHYIGLVEDLALRSVEARLAKNLLKNAQYSGDQLFVPRRSWTTFDEMAVRLGTVRDVLSRALHTLENEGLLKVERSNIIILDPRGLEKRGKT
jgi:CRP/FNR family transcriptional regulator